MNRRQLLSTALCLVVIAGLCAVFVPFVASLAPAEGADLKLPHIDVSSLRSGQYRMVITNRSFGFGAETLLVIKDGAGALHVFTVSTKDGAVVLPDNHWWRWGALCKDFGPTLTGGLVAPDAVLSCHDLDAPDWQKTENRWALSGKNLGRYTDDMPAPVYVFEEPYIVIGKRG